jgi:hypothetical protein
MESRFIIKRAEEHTLKRNEQGYEAYDLFRRKQNILIQFGKSTKTFRLIKML